MFDGVHVLFPLKLRKDCGKNDIDFITRELKDYQSPVPAIPFLLPGQRNDTIKDRAIVTWIKLSIILRSQFLSLQGGMCCTGHESTESHRKENETEIKCRLKGN